VEKRALQARSFPLASASLSPEWRMDVHRAADEVESWATGVRGISATRIAYSRGNQVWLIDSDGAFATPVEGTADGRSPAWDPTGRYIAFSTLAGSDAGAIVMRDLWTGSNRRMTSSVRNGAFAAPAFSPDGKMLAYAYSMDGTDVFAVDPAKPGRPSRITVGRSGVINTSPSFSPDGRKIAFTSSRLNHAEVYICDVDGSNVELLTQGGFGDQFYRSSPAWSPDGRAIVFQSQIDGQFQIMLISPSGKSLQALTSDSENEDPFWAPDGRHLVFTSVRSGSPQLWVLDTEGARVPRQLTRGPAVNNAAWSPPLTRR
jgi:TolB protein